MGEAFVYITKDVKSTGATLAGISEWLDSEHTTPELNRLKLKRIDQHYHQP